MLDQPAEAREPALRRRSAKPGIADACLPRQGISLSIEQYQALLQAIPEINAVLLEKGYTVGNGDVNMAPAPPAAKKPSSGVKDKSRKANIEATSDEEEE